MPQEKPVTVEIFKQTYQLGTSEGRDAEYVRRAAAYLDEKMNEAAAAVGNRAPLDIAILAALNIAEEVLAARQQKERMLDQADAQIDSFTQLLTDPDDKDDAEEDPPASTRRFYLFTLYIVLGSSSPAFAGGGRIERTPGLVFGIEPRP